MTRTEHDSNPPTGASYKIKAWVLPGVILIAAVAVTILMVKLKPDVEKQVIVTPPPLVRILEAAPQSYRYTIREPGNGKSPNREPTGSRSVGQDRIHFSSFYFRRLFREGRCAAQHRSIRLPPGGGAGRS